MVPVDIGSGSVIPLQTQFPQLTQWNSKYGCIFQSLDKLEHPDKLNLTQLDLTQCMGEADSELLEPYLRDRIRRDVRLRSRLEIRLGCESDSIFFGIGILGECDTPPMPLGYGYHSLSFLARFRSHLPHSTIENLCTTLIAAAPREHVMEFTGGPNIRTVRDLPQRFPPPDHLASSSLLPPSEFEAGLQPNLPIIMPNVENCTSWGL